MSEEFTFDIDEKSIDNLKKAIGYDEIQERHKRFMEGKETIDDLINGIYHYKIKNDKGLDLDVVELKYYKKVIDLYNKEKEKNKELEKMLKLKSHKRRYNTLNYIKKNKLNKFDTVGVCQDMRAFKRTGEIKYRAYITFQNKQYTLGTYTSLDKAKEARKKGEIMVENIKKNFVEKIKGEE